MTLKAIYDRALQACAPEKLIRRIMRDDLPRAVVALGKCAGALLDGFGEVGQAFVAIPAGYPRPRLTARVFEGGHPQITAASFEAGKALLDFVAAHDAITFLISGGGSACVEWPLDGFGRSDLVELNARLIRSGASIHDINCVRKHVSAIKGGRLAASLARSVTLIYSDVATGALADVASGPSLPDPTTKEEAAAIAARLGIGIELREETPKRIGNSAARLIADNATFVAAAASAAEDLGMTPIVWPEQIETDVQAAANALADAASSLHRGEVLIAGGEPTVVQRGDGVGGRCSELAVRFATKAAVALRETRLTALFASSDGVDGSSGSAGVMLRLPRPIDAAFAEQQLDASNSMAVIERIGEAIPSCPTGNNLRDIYLLACS